ncbi:MAG: cobalamin-binding protein [Halolamina sp.]|uniref:cobalamin-binding protein n=1 Tax=Halolamina sp. TaxID=1940283 RepID=UPI002FC339AE
MRLVSLAPSATATLAAMDAGAALLGATVHCDLDAVDTTEEPERVGGWLNPDYDRVAALDPDLVLTSDALQREHRDELRSRGLSGFHREPGTLEEVIEGFATLGEAVGAPDAGEALAADARERLEQVEAAVADEPVPTVYCEEWSDPPMVAGNWVPEAVGAAGGAYPFCEPGQRSREVSAEEVDAADPDHVVLHLCGHGETVDPNAFRARGWAPAAAVHVVDDATLNQPSPRLLDGIERLATLFHGADLAP